MIAVGSEQGHDDVAPCFLTSCPDLQCLALSKLVRYIPPFLPGTVGTGPNDTLPPSPCVKNTLPQVNVHSRRKQTESSSVSRSSARTHPPPLQREAPRGEGHLGVSRPPAVFPSNRRISCYTDGVAPHFDEHIINADNGRTPTSGFQPSTTTASGNIAGDVAAVGGRGSGGRSSGAGSFHSSGVESGEAAAAASTAVSVAEIGLEGGAKIPYRESRFSPRRGRRKRQQSGGDDGDCGDDVDSQACSGSKSQRCERLFELGDQLQR